MELVYYHRHDRGVFLWDDRGVFLPMARAAAGADGLARATDMTTPLRRPARWSKKTDQLVRHVALGCRPGLQSELGQWLEDCSRFRDFVTANQDKVRKKLSTPHDEDSRLDVRSELLVAYLVLADRRFELAFEAYGARRLGPDLSLTFRANQRLNLEVTRLRATRDPGNAGDGLASGDAPPAQASARPDTAEPDPAVNRLANVIAAKLRQLPGDVPNVLVVTARGLPLSEESLVAAVRLLKMHSDRKDDAFFARRGLRDARDFYAQFLHFSGLFVLDEATAPPSAIFAANREARHPLSKEALAGLSACLAFGRGGPA